MLLVVWFNSNMLTLILTIVVALLPIIAELLGRKQSTAQEKKYEQKQQGRNDIVSGDIPAVEQRIDELLSQEWGDSSGTIEDPEDVERRLRAVCGVSPE